MKSNYEERKANRLEAFENLAAKNESLSNSLYEQSNKMASDIPFGQPVLVGHHSEKRDRNYRAKIHNTMGRSIEAGNKAEYYKGRAETLLNGTAISSDDPNAIDKLTEKLERLEALQELYKAINKTLKKKVADPEKVILLTELGLKEATAVKMIATDQWGRVGIPSYRLTNNNGMISNTRKRIEHLTRLSAVETSQEEINGVTLKVSAEDNRVQLFFPDKPSEEVRKSLKSCGFHFCYENMAWQRQISNYAIYQAKNILETLKAE